MNGIALLATPLQSALDPAGIQAERIGRLYSLFFYVSLAVWLLVVLATFVAIWRGRRGTSPDRGVDARGERRARALVTLAAFVTTVILFVLLVASVRTGHAVATLPSEGALVIDVTGHQWWWQFDYLDARPDQSITASNEMHIPVGRVVKLRMTSRDVIHSFWVPNLQGKKDLIPGKTNVTTLRADRPGIYRGQCAEFCGLQHAHMSLLVIAEPPEQYEAWLRTNRQPARLPTTPEEARGREVVERAPCANCHTIRGTRAGGRLGPDLTHVGSNLTLGAGTIDNNKGALAGWIANAQALKPGCQMPPNDLAPDDLLAVTAYLQSLK